MSSVVISGNTSGTVTLDAPAVAGTTVLTLPATSGTVIVGTAGVTSIASGGTGQSTANAAYNALSPMTTTGDIEYRTAGSVAARLGIGTEGQLLSVASGIPAWATVSSTPTTAQVLTATAGATAGAVGTYAFLQHATGGTAVSAGTNYAGSGLLFSGLGPGSTSATSTTSGTPGSAPSGTWKAMGTTTPFNASYFAITVFLRVS